MSSFAHCILFWGEMFACVMIRHLVIYKCLSNCCETTTYSNDKCKSCIRHIQANIVHTIERKWLYIYDSVVYSILNQTVKIIKYQSLEYHYCVLSPISSSRAECRHVSWHTYYYHFYVVFKQHKMDNRRKQVSSITLTTF